MSWREFRVGKEARRTTLEQVPVIQKGKEQGEGSTHFIPIGTTGSLPQ